MPNASVGYMIPTEFYGQHEEVKCWVDGPGQQLKRVKPPRPVYIQLPAFDRLLYRMNRPAGAESYFPI